jgi:hypothetical protein
MPADKAIKQRQISAQKTSSDRGQETEQTEFGFAERHDVIRDLTKTD